MKKFVFCFLAIFITMFASATNWKEGDIVFQTSKSRQSPLIQYATLSPWSHCGIIVEKKGQFYVLEASNVVKLTPVEGWCKRGKFGYVKKVRILDKDVKINYSKYLGKSYDLQFKFNNGKYYCSELVYEIYKDQLGIELCKPKPIKSYNILGIKDKIHARGMNENQLVVAPCDLIP